MIALLQGVQLRRSGFPRRMALCLSLGEPTEYQLPCEEELQ